MLITETTTFPELRVGQSYAFSVSGYDGHRTVFEYQDENGWQDHDGTERNSDCEIILTVISEDTRLVVTGGTGSLAVNWAQLPEGYATVGPLAVTTTEKTTRMLDLYFGNLGNLTTLSAQADPEDMTLTLTDTTGFVDGTRVGVFSANDPDIFYLGTQLGAPVGSVITLDSPIDQELQVGSSVAASSIELAVDGSITTQHFQIGPVGPGSTQVVNLTRIMGHMLDSTAMDDGKFGGIPALTNGLVLRHNNSVIENIWNVKTNADIALLCFDFKYSDKAPGGQFGANFRNTYAGDSKHGVVVELQPGDYLEILVQDDLTGLDEFQMMAQGHFL